MRRTEIESKAHFERRYSLTSEAVALRVEREVLGEDYGGNGYATAAQILELAERLNLGPEHSVLDVGAGCGWPGLYLARVTGCRMVCVDLPLSGMVRARNRSLADQLNGRLDGRCQTVASGMSCLPFREGVFDAVVHADVLC